MKIETFFAPSRTDSSVAPAKAFLIAGTAAVVLLAIYWPTARSIYAIWQKSETFAHGFLVIPAVLWLLWRDRVALQQLPVRPCLGALVGLAAAGFLWMAAQLATVSVVSQFALLFMVQLSIITILGLRMSRRIAFPLAFLIFAVPFGEFLMPWLIDRTGDATVLLLKLSGVPVYREGNSLLIPSGRWSVVEACSGLRYLIASLVAGTIYAFVRYSSLRLRLSFVAAAIAVPLVANWLRAYGIVMLAHFTDNKFGTNIDHLIYGWLFFGLVMTLLFYVGSLWQEEPSALSAKANAPVESRAADSDGNLGIVGAGLLCVAIASAWPMTLAYLEAQNFSAAPSLRALAPSNGWAPTAPVTSWRPKFLNASAELSQQFTKDGQTVGVYIAYYRNQKYNAKLVSTENVLVRNDDPYWKVISQKQAHQSVEGGSVRAQSVLALGRGERLAMRQWYWINDQYTGSPYAAAVLLLAAQLGKHGDDAAAVVTYTLAADDQNASAKTLDAFAADMSESLAQLFSTAHSK